MVTRNFNDMLRKQWADGKYLCVGLDTDIEKVPEHLRQLGVRKALVSFNRGIVDAVKGTVCAFKPNSAFYEAYGDEGLSALRETIMYINEVAGDVPVILDAKRGDIGNTNLGYITAAFEHLHADAITLHPYLGSDALQPFLDNKEKGIFVLCRTSNGGSAELQNLIVDGEPLYKKVAHLAVEKWNTNGNCGLVVGATYPEELAEVRVIAGDMPILIPGIGAQGGDVEAAARAGRSAGGGMILNASRSVIYASGGENFAEAAGKEAERLHKIISSTVV